ncbi:MAG TPA: SDR family NAD(P)-dependent oxidoreductase [Tepidisphaeraceae bacterium]|jgi:CDP-paratose 2-epimerase
MHDARPKTPTAALPFTSRKPVLITGGCGFIGTNLAHRLLSAGQAVIVFDNLSRPGVERNLAWLQELHPRLLTVHRADVRDGAAVLAAVEQAGRVFHLAAQVAVTTSLTHAIDDFEINARGTLNLLEAVRAQPEPPSLVFTSTNKVYGGLNDVTIRRQGSRYEPQAQSIREHGIGENRPLDFHSPYGCSKGAADQYVLDYARTFDLPMCVFRMSCIYGPHQCGTEDQGWIAHFLIQALQGRPVTLYGDGMQVRDILFVDDLVEALLLAQANMHATRGEAFNIGGGPANTISLLDLLDLIERLHGTRPDVRCDAWRPGDQRFYVSDPSKMRRVTGWTPRVSAQDGVERLYQWLRDNVQTKPETATAVPVAEVKTPRAWSQTTRPAERRQTVSATPRKERI